MLEGFFKSKAETEETEQALAKATKELHDRRIESHAKWAETPWTVKENVRGWWDIHANNLNWMTGQIWLDPYVIGSFPTKELALAGVKRLANPETVSINRHGEPEEKTNASA